MHIDPAVAVAGLIVGFTVGLTGMGGGALMTPILVLLFKVQPLAAVSSDLVASVIMKPVGGGVHLRRGTVNFALVRWLMVGSVPAAFAGVLVLRAFGDGAIVQARIEQALGVALVVAASSIAAKALLQFRAARRAARDPRAEGAGDRREVRVRPLPTVLVGVAGGLVVGMTSVGSGSLMIVLLMLLYPMLRSSELVGTDLVQAVPLVGSAALGHVLFGDFKLDLTASLLVGCLPGVYVGAKVSSRARDVVIRPALAIILLASGLKLLDLGTPQLAAVVTAVVLLAVPLWGVLDAISQPAQAWIAAKVSRRAVVGVQSAGAPFGVGFVAALLYFGLVRPKLVAATVPPAPPRLPR
ncbi:MAG TPA: sulfite exporter TauE/SafE family protein [Actinomycetota bacterium]